MSGRTLVVSIDTEVDKDAAWRISSPPRFRSVVEGVPNVLSPLFARYGAVPTYLLSPEVIEDDASVAVLRDVGEVAELGTHLHPAFVEPGRLLWPTTMGGRTADEIQRAAPREVEQAKLAGLTSLFEERFGRRPTAFRAGRYGSGDATLELLAGLGYRVDSSVTPGVLWRYVEGVVDHRRWEDRPRVVTTPAGPIVELPVSIRPASRAAPLVQRLPPPAARVVRRLLRGAADFRWLRPSWGSPDDLVRFARTSDSPVLVCMFHSIEVIAGASPYARSAEEVRAVVDRLEALLRYWSDSGGAFAGMTKAAAGVAA